MGMKIKREMEKVEKISPTRTPSAPIRFAYSGKRGAMMPMPKLETATDRARTRKMVLMLFSGVSAGFSVDWFSTDSISSAN
jgi:hypothetical protein